MTTEAASVRARALAEQYMQATADLLEVVEGCSAAQWQTRCMNEARTVGVLVHHLATAAHAVTGMLTGVAAGQPAPQLTMAMIDHANARHAAEHGDAGQGETLALLRQNSAATAAFIETLSDAQLEITAALPVLGPDPAMVSQMIQNMLIGHTLGHLASIQAAIVL